MKRYGVMPGMGITGVRPGGKTGPMKPASRDPKPASKFGKGVRTYTDSWADWTYSEQLAQEGYGKIEYPEIR